MKNRVNELLKEGCANYQNHRCRGCDIWGRFCRPMASCLVKDGLRCKYFEMCVLPLGKHCNKYAGAEREYFHTRTFPLVGLLPAEIREHPFFQRPAAPAGKQSERECPDCGGPLPKRHRYCPECAERRRRQSYRASKRKLRSDVHS